MSTPSSRTRTWQAGELFTVSDATELYEVDRWGKGYFSISNDGHVLVHPTKDPARAIDLKELVDQLQVRGIQLPILLRFRDILRHRVGEIHDAFRTAINEYEYEGRYCCVYPIKVNQQRHVVEEILDFGKPYHFGLEAGSKPELLAVLALTDHDTPIICNGFKDDEFIKMTMLARKIGKQIIPVVEKFTELRAIVRHSRGARTSGRSSGSASSSRPAARPLEVERGFRSKFGLTLDRGPRGLEYLKQRGHGRLLPAPALPPRQPDHQHPQHQGGPDRGGADLRRAVQGRGRRSSTSTSAAASASTTTARRPTSSRRSTTRSQEYANDVVFRVKSVCDEAEVPHPTIISESGRAVVAYHSVLVFDVLGVSNFDADEASRTISPDDAPQPITDLFGIHRDLSRRTPWRATTTPCRRSTRR